MKERRKGLLIWVCFLLSTISLCACGCFNQEDMKILNNIKVVYIIDNQRHTAYADENGNFQLPKIPSKEGYEFAGFYTQEKGNGEQIIDASGKNTIPIEETVTVFAHWILKTYRIVFNAGNGKLFEEEAVQDFEYGSIITHFPYAENNGVPLRGWRDQNGQWYSDGTIVNKDKTCFTEATYLFDGDSITLYAEYNKSKPIGSVEELMNITKFPTEYYHLTADIDFKGSEWVPIEVFQGVLDGRGHTISNFIINSTNERAGFICLNEGTVCNLTLKGFTFSVSVNSIEFNAGVLTAINRGTVQNCHIKDGVASVYYYHPNDSAKHYKAYCGGLVGKNEKDIFYCTTKLDMSGTVYNECTDGWNGRDSCVELLFGGIIGNNEGYLSFSTSNTVISLSLKSSKPSGREISIVGQGSLAGAVGCNRGYISDSLSIFKLSITSSEHARSGTVGLFAGFCTYNKGIIERCSAEGTMMDSIGTVGSVKSGGFVYENRKIISNCYADVIQKIDSIGHSASYQGIFAPEEASHQSGFVCINSCTIVNCYATGLITTATKAGVASFVGVNSAGGAISNCFSSVPLNLLLAEAKSGYFVGISDGGTIYNCYYNKDAGVMVNDSHIIPDNIDGKAEVLPAFSGEVMIYNTLNWSREFWHLKGETLPTLRTKCEE